MGNEGVSRLASVLQCRMHSVSRHPQILDFGVIQDDMSLLTNLFPLPIPQKDYMICRQLALGAAGTHLADTATGEGAHSHAGGSHGHDGDGQHDHEVLVPWCMRSIQAGDRVLVAWVGDDACVVDIILPGTAV